MPPAAVGAAAANARRAAAARRASTANAQREEQEQLDAQGIDAGGWRIPIFSCDELQSPRMLPLFLSRADLAATWVAAGRPKESIPENVTVMELRLLVAQMQTAAFDWSIVHFIAPEASMRIVQAAQETAAKADPLDEPPPLE